jgi:hypothetical protein
LEFHGARHHDQLFAFHSAVVRVEWSAPSPLQVQQNLHKETARRIKQILCRINNYGLIWHLGKDNTDFSFI